MTEKKQILKSASIITLATITSHIFAYVRDQRITLLLGTLLTRVAVTSAAMGILCCALLRFSGLSTCDHFLPLVARFVLVIAIGALFYLGLGWLMRCPEVREVFGILRRPERAPAVPLAMME